MILSQGERYCILRNNILVPLVLTELPRQLTPRQMVEEGWKLVREVQAPADVHPSQPVPPAKTVYLPPDHNARKDPVTATQVAQPPRESSHASFVHTEQAIHRSTRTSPPERPASVTDTIASVYARDAQRLAYRTPTPSGIEPDPSKKVYCTHWMKSGECNFIQQGCRFKHEMPDRKKLRELGFLDIPKWYRDRTAISAGASNWLRRGMAEDNNNRQLSTEPPASHAFRPSILANRLDQPRSKDMAESTISKDIRAPVEIENLIDLDDSPPTTPSSSLSTPVSSSLSAAPDHANANIVPLSEKLFQTIVSTLKEKAIKINGNVSEAKEETQPVNEPPPVSDDESHTDTLSAPGTPIKTSASSPRMPSTSSPTATTCNTDDSVVPPSKLLSQTMASELRIAQGSKNTNNKGFEVNSDIQLTNNSSVATSNERNTKASKLHKKRGPRPRKPAGRPAVPGSQTGLAISKHATGTKTGKDDTPNKSGKRRGTQCDGMDLQSEITQRQRAIHEKERLSKGVKASDSQSRHTQPVASAKVEATRLS